jgi:hypothetical protein
MHGGKVRFRVVLTMGNRVRRGFGDAVFKQAGELRFKFSLAF